MNIQLNEKIKKRLEIEIKKAYYSAQRYKAVSTFAFLFHTKELSPTELGSLLRISDHILKIDDHHFFINFTQTSHEDAFKAAQNLLFKLDNHFKDQTSAIAIDNFNVNQTPSIVLHRLVEILHEVRKHSYTRIDDESILNDLF